jgi:hypothetical protein
MAWPDDVDRSLDYLVWTNTETVAYFSKAGDKPPTVKTADVSHVLFFPIKKDFLPPSSPLLTMDATFRMAVVECGTIVPKVNDILQRADGSRWVVKHVDVIVTEYEYRLLVVRGNK